MDEPRVFGTPRDGATFRPTAYGLILDENDRVAIVRGDVGFLLPGGGIEDDETPVEAIEREIWEECGRRADVGTLVCRAVQHFIAACGTPYWMTADFHVARFTSDTIGQAEHELRWFDRSAVPTLFHPCHLWAIECAPSIA